MTHYTFARHSLFHRLLNAYATLLLSTTSALAGFRIELDSDLEHVRYHSHESLYYTLLTGSDILSITNAVDMRTGRSGMDELANHGLSQHVPKALHRVCKIRLDTPHDTDGDGLHDALELRTRFLHPLDNSDAHEDEDHDGFSNLHELLLGSDPERADDPPHALHADTDFDHYPDAYERFHNSDPNDENSTPPPNLYVDPDASSGGNGSEEKPFRTIQAALDAASHMDIIFLAPKLYEVEAQLNMAGKAILLDGWNATIDAEGSSGGFSLTNNEGLSTVLLGLIIARGTSSTGSALYCEGTSPTIDSCVFVDNTAWVQGGAVYVSNGGTPAFINCTFLRNSAPHGGAIYATGEGTAPTIMECTAVSNTASSGGAAAAHDRASPVFIGCILTHNRSHEGGAIYAGTQTTPLVSDTTLFANQARFGGGLYARAASPRLERVWISGNIAEEEGGGIASSAGSTLLLRNSFLVENRAEIRGGGLYGSTSDAFIFNCTIAGNAAGPVHRGGGIYLRLRPRSHIENTILWANTPDQVNGVRSARYSIIQGGWWGTEVSTADPQLTQDYRLTAESPAIDAGSQRHSVLIDFDGDPRTDDPDHPNDPSFVDIGADEFVRTGDNTVASHRERFLPNEWERPIALHGSEARDTATTSTQTDYDPTVENLSPDRSALDSISVVSAPMDSDGDTMPDHWEIEHNLDPYQRSDAEGDSDSDALTNRREFELDTIPSLADSDQDGLEDGAEVDLHGTDPLDIDTDRDAIQDGYEVHYTSDPLDPQSRPNPTYIVDTSAQPGGDGSSEHPYKTIQEAIDASSAWDIIFLRPGTYAAEKNEFDAYSPIEFQGKAITLLAEDTVILPPPNGHAVVFSDNETRRSMIYGATFRSGNDTNAGGVACRSAHPSLIECSFEGISFEGFADQSGSRAFTGQRSDALLRDCSFSRNTSKEKGGAVYLSGSSPRIEGCTFSSNFASRGGAIAGVTFEGTPQLIGCIFRENQAFLGGALYSENDNHFHIENCILSENVASNRGGVAYNTETSPTFIHCTLSRNRAREGGALYTVAPRRAPTLRNSIVWHNVPDSIAGTGSPADIRHSNIQGGWPGDENIDVDPILTGEQRLTFNSPCIGTADPAHAPATDFEGEVRAGDSETPAAVDMGADEFVDTDGDALADAWERMRLHSLAQDGSIDNDTVGGPDGLSNLQEYLHGTDPNHTDTDRDGLSDGHEVTVSHTSPLHADTDNDALPDAWEIAHGLQPLDPTDRMNDEDEDTFGNFYEFLHGTDPRNADEAPAPTRYVTPAPIPRVRTAGDPPSHTNIQAAIDAAVYGDIIQIEPGIYTGTGNCPFNTRGKIILVRGVEVDIDCANEGRSGAVINHGEDDRTVLYGLTIQRFSTGIRCSSSSSPRIEACTLRDGRVGVQSQSRAAPLFLRCTIMNNANEDEGGGVRIESSSPRFVDCLIANNSAISGGAVKNNNGAAPQFNGCVFRNNSALLNGGVASSFLSDAQFDNCIFHNNSAKNWGGVFYNVNATLLLRHGTLVDNNAGGSAGAVYHSTGDTNKGVRIENSILWGNVPEVLNTVQYVELEYSNIEGGGPGIGIINREPRFGGDFRLQPDSPCIDAGRLGQNPTTDIDGEPRVSGTAPDLGADEFVDTDDDGMADAWERAMFGNLSRTGEADQDLDGGPDGLTDREEYAHGTDPFRSDTDGDGLDDHAELCRWNTQPNNTDTDHDGIDDGWETAHGLHPANASDGVDDLDRDGIPNYYEFLYDTEPDNPNDRPTPVIFVDREAAPDGDGSASRPFTTISAALHAANDGDIVHVAPGVYTGRPNRGLLFDGKAILLTAAGVTIDCEQKNRAFSFAQGETHKTVIQGLTMRNGLATEGGASRCFIGSPTFLGCTFTSNRATSTGGALSITDQTRPRIIDCVFLHNESAESGGAVYSAGSRPEFVACTFEHNTAGLGGGAMANIEAPTYVKDCVFRHNESEIDGGAVYHRRRSSGTYLTCTLEGNRSSRGGAIFTDDSSPILSDCYLQNNIATNSGGAMYMFSSDPTLRNCTLTDNQAAQGGAIFAVSSRPRVINSTLADNQAADTSGGFHIETLLISELWNCILWSNVPSAFNTNAMADVRFSSVQEGWPGHGNQTANPLLTAAYRLQAASPCLDAGDPVEAPPRDADGERRQHASGTRTNDRWVVDLGADEFVDEDLDSLADLWEREHFLDLRTTSSEDTDEDGLTELQEYTYDTDPRNADTDGDGVTDGEELTHGTDPRDPNDS